MLVHIQNTYTVSQKTAMFHLCSNFVKPIYMHTILVHLYFGKFGTNDIKIINLSRRAMKLVVRTCVTFSARYIIVVVSNI